MYDNEAHCQVEEYNACAEGHWFEDEDGFLYILPPKGVIASNEGPDNATMDKLGAIIEKRGHVSEAECAKLHVTSVERPLRRWNEKDGYYHA